MNELSLSVGPFSAFLSSCTWAIGSGVYSRLSEEHSAFSVNFTRALVALPLFLMSGFFAHGLESLSLIQSHHLQWLFLSMVASYGLADVIFLRATRLLGVPSALSIASAYPLWTVLFGKWTGERDLTSWQWMGLILTLVGVIYTLQVGAKVRAKGREQSSRTVIQGVVLGVMTSLLWSMNSFSIAQVAGEVPVHWVNSIRMALALVVCGFLGALSLRRSGVSVTSIILPWRNARPVFWVFPFEAFGGSLFFAYGLANSPLVLGATLSSLAPVISVPIAWILKKEQVSMKRMAGVTLVVGGLMLLFYRS